ncbi:OmpA family protein [Verrucomicrobiales bacterium]|nr:OmpA family protein [Verrucomicrobiales bacterium]MDF1788011.1 OmpA family protein [Verrucomicrobiales bacterium]
MDFNPPPAYQSPPPDDMRRPGSHGALIAGLLTVAALGGAVGLYHWISNRPADEPAMVSSTIGQPATTEVAVQEAPATPPNEAKSSKKSGTAPTTLVKHIVRSLLGRDEWAVDTLLGNALTKPERRALMSAINQGSLSMDTEQPVTYLGPTSTGERWAINLRPTGSTSSDQLLVEFSHGEGEWLLSSAQLPEALKTPIQSTENGEADEHATAFVDVLLAGDLGDLKSLVNPEKVTDEKLAALGIIMDETKFQIKPGTKGLKTTNVSEDRAWVVAKVHSPNYQLDSEFGLELKKEGESWIVDRINLSTLMSGFTSMAADADAFQSPLVTTPAGGDSLVLYFGYDDEKLTTRSMKQLSVVASLLKQSSTKRIQIGGHTDALGDDSYNDALSQRRASKVAEMLQSFGVRRNQINLEAFGERLPLSPNLNPDGTDNPDGRERNRRAEIYLDF